MAVGPPGLAAGPTSAPPLEPPPPAPPGLWQSLAPLCRAADSAGVDEKMAEKQKGITGAVASQVSRLLEQARVDTETKVKVELKGFRDAVVLLDGKLDQLLAQIDGIDPPPTEAPLDAEHVGHVLSKIEQQWGQEIRTLKEELHQTILAHNHNADLIKHHKETIDLIRNRCKQRQTVAKTRTETEVQRQLARVQHMPMPGQQQRRMEPLFKRLVALEQKVATAMAQSAAAWRYPTMSPQMSTMAMPPGLRPPQPMGGMSVPQAAAMMSKMTTAAAAAVIAGGKGTDARPPAAVAATGGVTATATAIEQAKAAAMAAALQNVRLGE